MVSVRRPVNPQGQWDYRSPAGARDRRARASVYRSRRLGQLNRKKRRADQVKVGLALILLWAAAAGRHLRRQTPISTANEPRHGFAVSDGDTVKFGRQLIRLFGIDAPGKLQPCDDGKWFPEPLATEALVRIIGGRPVSCRQVDYDRKEQPPGRWYRYAGEDDLQEQMVLAGWAWAYTQYSDRYLPEEKDAMARKVGVHAHRCQQPPWEWRALRRVRAIVLWASRLNDQVEGAFDLAFQVCKKIGPRL